MLRLGAAVTGSAFLTMLLPVDTMASVHESLGLGPFPRTPIVDYLSRSLAAFYGFHGVLLFLISTDPVRYKPFVQYVGWMNMVLGVMMILIDLHAGMPAWWTLGEGPPVIAAGLLILYLSGSLVPGGAAHEGHEEERRSRRN